LELLGGYAIPLFHNIRDGSTAATPYFFAMKTRDDASNWSDISNVATATTAESGDEVAPGDVSDLNGAAISPTAVLLTWTAPGDDGTTGTATEYDVRYATTMITNATWATATPATGEPMPEVAGAEQDLTINALTADQDYYFAIKTRDEAGNESGLSNVKQITTPAEQASPPGLLIPEFPDSVCITSEDLYATWAKASVQLQLALVNAYAGLANAFFGPLQGADWEHLEDCWSYDYAYGGCTAHYEVCQDGSQYVYTMTVDGSCYGETYDDWVQYRATVDTDARTGTFLVYELNTTNVEAAWIWTWAADENSGTYTFYSGDPGTTPIDATIEWSRSVDRNVFDVTYTQPEELKTVTHFMQEPCSGWQHGYQWDDSASDWWMENDIVWESDGTGYWDIYDDQGTLQEHHAW